MMLITCAQPGGMEIQRTTALYALACKALKSSLISLISFTLCIAIPPEAKAQGTWTAKTSMPTSRSTRASGVIGGKLYVAGGLITTSPSETYTNVLEVYDPVTATWETKAPMPTTKGPGGAGVIDGKLYVVTGIVGASQLTNVLEVYDPAANSWSTKTPIPQALASPAVAVLDGKLYVSGGYDLGGLRTSLYVYDPVIDSWGTNASMSVGRDAHVCCAISGKLYVAGGGASGVYSDEVEVYNPAADTWTTVSQIPTARSHPGAGVIEDKIYIVGGYNSNGHLTTHEVYNPALNSWTTAPSLPAPRSNPAVQVISNKLYVVGGYDGADYTAKFEVYDPFPPSIALYQPTGIQSGNVTVQYVIADASSDTVSLLAEYSTNDGAGWLAASVTGDTSDIAPADYDSSLVWNSATDLSGQEVEGVWLRLTPRDSGGWGTPDTTYIYVDNRPPQWIEAEGAVGDTVVAFRFSEDVADTAASNISNITISGGLSIDSISVNDEWTTASSLPVSRNHTAAGFINGMLYVAGGMNQSGPDSSLYIYDPATDSWSTGSPMPTVRYGGAYGVIDNRLYVAGGITTGNSVIGTLEIYNPGTDSWITGADMPTPRTVPVSAVINGKLYITGGWDLSSMTTSLEVYNPATDSWTTRAPPLADRKGGTGCVLSGKLYVTAGEDISGNGTASTDIYDPATDSWTTGPSIPTMRPYAISAALSGKWYVYGGHLSAKLEVYDPVSNTWSSREDGPATISRAAPGVIDNRLYIAGGYSSTYLSDVRIYDPQTSFLAELTGGQTLPPATSPVRLTATNILDIWGNVASPLSSNEIPPSLQLPSIAVYQPTGVQNGDAAIPYVISDSDGNLVGLLVEFSLNNGASWGAASVTGDTSFIAQADYDSSLVWNTGTDLANQDTSDVWLRITPYDSGGLGTSDTTLVDVDNLAPQSITASGTAGDTTFTYRFNEPVTENSASSTSNISIYSDLSIDSLYVVDEWTSASSIPTALQDGASAVISGKLYVAGGLGTSGVLNTLYVYDPTTDGWTSLQSMTTARDDAMAEVIDGKLYVVGGTTGGSPIDTLEIYDPVTDSWISGAPISTARDEGAIGIIDGKLYVVGGVGGTTTSEVYDPNTDTWMTKAPMPTGRWESMAGVIDGKLYVAGGHNGITPLSTLEVYDPASDSWVTKTSMPVAIHEAMVGVIDGRLYVAGGTNGSNFINTVMFYDPAADSWTTRTSMPTARDGATTGVVNGKLYVAGGVGGSGILSVLEIYDPQKSFKATLTGGQTLPSPFESVTITAANISDYYGNIASSLQTSLEPGSKHSTGLVSWWGFDEGTGSVSAERTGAGNDASLIGATWADGIEGNALSLDGIDDYARVADDTTNLDGFEKMSVSFWFNSNERLNSSSSRRDFLHEAYDGQNSSSWSINYGDISGSLQTVVSGDIWFNTTALTYAAEFTADTWYMVALIYDKDFGTKLYVNGSQVASDNTLGTNSVYDSSTPLTIGARGLGSASNDHFFSGRIDEIKIWNVALTDSEVSSLYFEYPSASAPVIAVYQPTGVQSGDVTVPYVISDTDSNQVSLLVEYSLDKGTSWQAASVTGDTSEIARADYDSSLVWNSGTDIADQDTTAWVRIIPRDSGGWGTADTTYVDIDNLAPQWVAAEGTSGNTSFTFWFNELVVDSTATNISNFSLSDGLAVGSISGIGIDEWTTMTSMPTARNAAAIGVIEGVLYVAGGYAGGTNYLSTLEVYDPSTDSWTTKTDMPTARYASAAGVIEGKLYVAGGSQAGVYLSVLQVYDPSTDSWTTKTSMPTARAAAEAGVINGKLYVAGGYDGNYLSTLEIYDPSTDSWTTKTSMPTARYYPSAGVIEGRLYIAGGFNGSQLSTLEVYNPSTDSWTTKTSMPTARSTSAAEVINGKFYIIGGENLGFLSTLEVYDPSTDSWITKSSMPTVRNDPAAGVINGKLYVVGGVNSSGSLNILEVYTALPDSFALKLSSGQTLPPSVAPITVTANNISDYCGNTASSLESDPFPVSTDLPSIAVYQPTGILSGDVTVPYVISDTDSNQVSLLVEYSLNSGTSWLAASVTGDTSGIAKADYDNSLVWNTGTDLANQDTSNVWLRITPRDSGERGTADTTYVDIDNLAPQQISAEATVGDTTITFEFNEPVADSTATNTSNIILSGGFTIDSIYVNDSWTTKNSMPTSRRGAVAGEVNGKLYVAGGFDGGNYVGTLEIYDPESGGWSTGAAMSNVGYLAAGGVINSEFYVAGGYAGSSLNVLEVYDPVTDSWYPGASMPTDRYAAGADVINGKLYVVGGISGTVRVAVLEVYDPKTDGWKSLASMPTARDGPAVGVIDNKLYVAGGQSSSGGYLSVVEVYDPASDSWSTVTSMPSARNAPAAGVIGGKLIVAGGWDGISALDQVEIFDPVSNSWHTAASAPVARNSTAGAVLDGKLYVAGGQLAPDGYISTFEVYDPQVSFTAILGSGQKLSAYQTVTVTASNIADYAGNVASSLQTTFSTEFFGGLVAHYPFDGDADDASGNEYHGTVYGAVPASDRYGNSSSAYSFDGIDDYVDLDGPAYSYVWDFDNSSFTVSMWVYTTAVATHENNRFLNYGGSTWQQYGIIYGTDGRVAFNIGDANPESYSVYSTSALGDSKWHHIVVIRDNTDKQIHIYIDGVLENSSPGGFDVLPGKETDRRMRIGNAFSSANTHLNGDIDEVRIYDRVLDQSEILSLYSTAPSVVIYQPTGVQSGDVTVPFVIADADSNQVGLRVEYSLNEGLSWNPASVTGDTSDIAPADYDSSLVWNSGVNLVAQDTSGVWLRITPYDLGGSGTADTTCVDIDNLAPQWIAAEGTRGGSTFTYWFDEPVAEASATNTSNITLSGEISIDHISVNDTWATSTSMPTARREAAAGVIGGKLYVAGGWNGSYVNILEVYDPVAESWTTKASVPTSRYGAITGVIDGKLYVAGGYDGSYLNTLEVYDPVADSWTTNAPMSIARDNAIAGVIDGKLYVAGGNDGSSLLSTMEVYDPATDSWTSKASMNLSIYEAAAGVIDGKLYVAGGWRGSYLNTLEVYDPVADDWTTKTPMSIARHYAMAGVIDSKLYVAGGYDGTYLDTLEVYDPVADSWMIKAQMPTARYGAPAVVIGGRIFVAGGVGSGSDLGTLEIYNPQMNFEAELSTGETLPPDASTPITITAANISDYYVNTASSLDSTIGIITDSSAPSVTVGSLSEVLTWDIPIGYTLNDINNENLGFTPFWSHYDTVITAWCTWDTMTVSGTTTDIPYWSYSGSFTWHSFIDTDSAYVVLDSVRVKLIPYDSYGGGLADSSEVFTLKNYAGDYDHDMGVDYSDFDLLVYGWNNQIPSCDIGPVADSTEYPKRVYPIYDGIIDFEDLAVFSVMWNAVSASQIVLHDSSPRSKLSKTPAREAGRTVETHPVVITPVLPDDPWESTGDIATLKIEVKDIEDLNAAQLVLQYDPEHLVYLDTDLGTFLGASDGENVNQISLRRVDKERGLLELLLGRINPEEPAVSGSGVLATLRFKEISKGAHQFGISYDLRDEDTGILAGSYYQTSVQTSRVPTRFELLQNYPNPFNSETRIRFQLPTAQRVRLHVFNVRGQRVRTLVDKEMEAGYHRITWDGRGRDGQVVASGIYIYLIEAGPYRQSKKLTIIK